jgi:septation ring formation regulator EzrA
LKEPTREQLLAKADRLRPLEELVGVKGFQQWRAHIEEELKRLEEYSWNMASLSDSVNMEKAFAELGLIVPMRIEDLHSCFLSFRGARNFMRAKFNWLDKQVKDFQRTQEQLAKLDR